jgi:hemolysin III
MPVADQESPDVEARHWSRPRWRGRTHAWAFAVSIPAGTALVLAADGAKATTAAAIYAGTLISMLGASAAYHRLTLSLKARAVMRRLDHSMIFLLIAGTYVPFCLVALPRRWGIPMLAVVGALAALGVVLKIVAFGRIVWLQYALYPIIGWVAVVSLPELLRNLSIAQISLVVAGGLAYTVGSLVFWRRRPDPWPHVFGYHEVWHGFTLVAAALHFSAVATLVA